MAEPGFGNSSGTESSYADIPRPHDGYLVAVASVTVLMSDVPLHVARLDAVDRALPVVPAETAARTDLRAFLKIAEAGAVSFVKGAPCARRLYATVVVAVFVQRRNDVREVTLDRFEALAG